VYNEKEVITLLIKSSSIVNLLQEIDNKLALLLLDKEMNPYLPASYVHRLNQNESLVEPKDFPPESAPLEQPHDSECKSHIDRPSQE